jgi:hypothetical protein
MRTTYFARAIVAITAFGFVINSSCAPDTKRKTHVTKGAGPGGAGGVGNIDANGVQTRLATAVKKDAGKCTATAENRDAAKLQPTLDQLNAIGTPITYDQLPQGSYFLAKTRANFQLLNSTGSGATFDVYRESDVTINGLDLTDSCTDFAVFGTPPAGSRDESRNFPIDESFEVTPKGLSNVVDGTFHYSISTQSLASSDIGANVLSPADLQQLRLNQQARATINSNLKIKAPPASANNQFPHVPTPIKKIFHQKTTDNAVDATQGGKFSNATAEVQLYKVSDIQYALSITFYEAAGTRKVVLIYNFGSSASTTKAGSGMTTPSIPNKDAAAPTASVPATAKDPAAKDSSASDSNQNQQPSGNQQDEDAKAKAAEAAVANPQLIPTAPQP